MERETRRRRTTTRQREHTENYTSRTNERRQRRSGRRVNQDFEVRGTRLGSAGSDPERYSNSRMNRRSRRRDGESRNAGHAAEYRSRRHRRGPSVRREDWESYGRDGRSMFGEHPDSRGYEEYAGSNKRHPGLLADQSRSRQFNLRSTKNEEGLMRKLDEERLYRLGRRKRPRNHHNSTRLAVRDYENRQQFGTPFHPMQMYDPIKSEYEKEELDGLMNDDHTYRYEGYQRSGNTEGFGGREGGRQQGQDWLDEDEYREGHAPRYRGYGKYGSR